MITYESCLDLWVWYQYNIKTISTRIMYDDYDLDYASLSNDHYTYDLDEMCEHHMQNTSLDVHDSYEMQMNDIDDDYARDTNDYVELAYKHYAWYNM